MNVVRFKVKPDQLENYLKANDELALFSGQIEGRLVKTGDYSFCSTGLWESKEAMDSEMDNMISYLDTIRDFLEEISPELGVTDPVSGSLILEK
jgi:hypothetical protein|tara:strand:- start:233 stop:514 length:282 start_codon:yes stop_codon:yes gene_type:complete